MPAPKPSEDVSCKICAERDGSIHQVREMMFGTGAAYDYFLCRACGCLQLLGSVAAEEQYPSAYYSFRVAARPSGVRAFLRRWRNRAVFRGNLIGRAASLFVPYAEGADRWFAPIGARFENRILDVGCGAGQLPSDLVDAGFKHAEGIDPLLPDSVVLQLPPFVHKASLEEVSAEYDMIMFHHVLEHIPNQHGALVDAARLLRRGGICLIRVPVVPNEAWKRYGANWVQLDAPRHLFIHSVTSLQLVAERAGFKLDDIRYDSMELQFTGSELYSRGLPFAALPSAFSWRQRYAYRRQARRLNQAKNGDQAAFYFKKTLD